MLGRETHLDVKKVVVTQNFAKNSTIVLDALSLHRFDRGLFPYNDVFPLMTCQYHGRDIPCPNDPVAILENKGYGDISKSPGHPEETRIGRNASRCLFENGYASLAAYQKGEKHLDQFKIRTTDRDEKECNRGSP